MTKDYQNNLLELLEQFELEISNLYKLFAAKFPSHQMLWNNLSDQEKNHAAHIRKLSSAFEKGNTFFDKKNLSTVAIKIIIDDIKSTYKKTEVDQLSLINALSYSLSLENSIIEKKFYEHFSLENKDIAFMINKIKQETREHAQKVKAALEKEKNLH